MLKTLNPTRPESVLRSMDPRVVARLSGLDVVSRKVLAGKLKGERRSKKRGQSVEFADHRPYVVGDDLRRIDWNIFGRLDRLFLKLFLEEEDLSLHIVIDTSASHDCGEPGKFLLMQRLAMALSYIGLANLHRVTLTALGDAEHPVRSALRDVRGRSRAHDVDRWLAGLTPEGSSAFTEGCKRVALTRRGKGVMIVVSDFLLKEGYDTGLRLLVGGRYEVYALQVLSPQELEPNVAGDLRLKDVEDADTAEVTISSGLLKKYRATVQAYTARLREFCSRRDIVHQVVRSDTPVDTLVLDYLRRKGLLE